LPSGLSDPFWGHTVHCHKAVLYGLIELKGKEKGGLVCVNAGTASEVSLAFVKANVYYSYKAFIQSLA